MMRRFSPPRRAAAFLTAALSCAIFPVAARSQAVTTVAGSAATGIKDGKALDARFLVPTGLARTSNGTLYVSDPAAQRIRQMSPDGTVRTVAGSGALGPLGLSVAGGYRDGPALEAAFNQPAGLAVGPDGALYIADSFNACIRKLQNGVVSTVVGKPGESRDADGDATTARLRLPLSLAFDKNGTLWIADFGTGVRSFAHGVLTTIKMKSYPDASVTSVSVAPEDDGPVIAATPELVYLYDRKTQTDTYVGALYDAEDGPFGRPDQVLALGNGHVLFSDARNNNIRYMRLPLPGFATTIFSRIVAGGERELGIFNAGFADGAAESARFYSPRGLARDGNSVIVADAGNHRLRRVVLPNFRRSEAGPSDSYSYDRAHFEVVFISASNALWASMADDSVCARVERAIDASHRVAKPARCHTVRIDNAQLPQIESYVKTALVFRRIDVLVIGASPLAASGYPAAGANAAGAPALHAAMTGLLAAIEPTGARLVLMWLDDNYFFSDDENLLGHTTSFVFPDQTVPGVATFPALFDSLRDLPLSQYDTYNDFLTYEKQPDHLPLFVNPGTHLNSRGNVFLGDLLGKYLLDSGLIK